MQWGVGIKNTVIRIEYLKSACASHGWIIYTLIFFSEAPSTTVQSALSAELGKKKGYHACMCPIAVYSSAGWFASAAGDHLPTSPCFSFSVAAVCVRAHPRARGPREIPSIFSLSQFSAPAGGLHKSSCSRRIRCSATWRGGMNRGSGASAAAGRSRGWGEKKCLARYLRNFLVTSWIFPAI